VLGILCPFSASVTQCFRNTPQCYVLLESLVFFTGSNFRYFSPCLFEHFKFDGQPSTALCKQSEQECYQAKQTRICEGWFPRSQWCSIMTGLSTCIHLPRITPLLRQPLYYVPNSFTPMRIVRRKELLMSKLGLSCLHPDLRIPMCCVL
jgi:hypothetical protein